MKKIYRTLGFAIAICVLTAMSAHAGNRDRSGQAAAPQLLINPWGASSGWGNAGVSSTKGIEATFSNVAGIAFVRKTQIGYANTMYNFSANIMVNGLGIIQSLGKDGARGNIGLSATLVSMGKVPITTVEQPEGGIGTFSPIFVNLLVSYGYSISDFVHVGASGKIIHESIHNVQATGFALDIGVQYVAGRNEQLQLGVVLKNLGLPMRYKGDGMSYRANMPKNSFPTTFDVPSAAAEMPALLALGASYDFLFGKAGEKNIERKDAAHRLTAAISFIANAYSNDQFNLGLEYSLMDYFQVRGGYTFEKDMFNDKKISTNWKGPSAGVTLLTPLSKNEARKHQRIAIDYSYRFTVEWKGCHTIGARIIL
jgi:hypothetical protein